MNIKTSIFSVLAAAALTGCGQSQAPSAAKEAWNSINDPLRLNGAYDRSLAALPTSGNVETTPWTDTYWPSNAGGISQRWKTPGADQFQYKSPSLDELQNMSLADLALLSPAEKYDAFMGRYDFPLVKRERRRTSPDRASWEGICHGWAPAAINFAEPQAVLVESADGVRIPFGSSDIKALLSYYQGEISRTGAKMLGGRCNADLNTDPERALAPECRDTNAGAFHVVIANQLGRMQEAFVADVTRDLQVWNQPVHGFKAKVLKFQGPSDGAAEGTVREAVIETTMTYTVEVNPQWQALVGTSGHSDSRLVYKYRVEINDDGEIIGGEWLSENRPDFLWQQGRPEFAGYFLGLAEVYSQSLQGDALPDPTL